MYYGKHGPFKRIEAGQAMTFENDKVPNIQLLFFVMLSYGGCTIPNLIANYISLIWPIPKMKFLIFIMLPINKWKLERKKIR